MEAPLIHSAITPAILQKIMQKMNFKELAALSRTSTFGEWAVEYFRGKELKEIEKAKLAEVELKKILFPANEEQLSLPLLKAYKNTSKWLVESAEKELDETKQYPDIPTGLVEITEERLQRITHTVELVEVVIKFWNILHSKEERAKQIYFDDSVFG